MALTPYPYAVGKDPTFDAFRAKYDFTKANNQADADQRRAKAEEDYQAALASLNQQGTYGRRNLDTSMLQRGIFKSGETNRRRGELESTLLQGRSAADTSRVNTLSQTSADLQRAMTSLDLDWQSAVSEALRRMKGSGGGSGGGGGGGTGMGGGGTGMAPMLPPAGLLPAPTAPTSHSGAGAGRTVGPYRPYAPAPIAPRPRAGGASGTGRNYIS